MFELSSLCRHKVNYGLVNSSRIRINLMISPLFGNGLRQKHHHQINGFFFSFFFNFEGPRSSRCQIVNVYTLAIK